jgi:transcriptional antiterminator RfaH
LLNITSTYYGLACLGVAVAWGDANCYGVSKMNKTNSKSWYVLTCKPRQDAYAEEQLNNQGYTTYRPLAIREQRRRGKVVKVTESLFPRYMFVELDAERDNWSPIRSTYGVSGFVKFGGMPLSVTESLVTNLRNREAQYQDKAIDLDQLQRGDIVTIKGGPFEGLDAIFERYSGEERAILLMNILNEQAKVAVSPADLYKTA